VLTDVVSDHLIDADDFGRYVDLRGPARRERALQRRSDSGAARGAAEGEASPPQEPLVRGGRARRAPDPARAGAPGRAAGARCGLLAPNAPRWRDTQMAGATRDRPSLFEAHPWPPEEPLLPPARPSPPRTSAQSSSNPCRPSPSSWRPWKPWGDKSSKARGRSSFPASMPGLWPIPGERRIRRSPRLSRCSAK
jgi:hypothetical protein